jgi:hypothetical protein
MNNKFKKILLLYKRSAYSIYSMDKGGLSRKKGDPQLAEELKYFKRIHDWSTLRQTFRRFQPWQSGI